MEIQARQQPRQRTRKAARSRTPNRTRPVPEDEQQQQRPVPEDEQQQSSDSEDEQQQSSDSEDEQQQSSDSEDERQQRPGPENVQLPAQQQEQQRPGPENVQLQAQRKQQRTDDDSLALFDSIFSFAKQYFWPILFYIFGLLLVLYATGFAVTPTQQEEYKHILSTTDFPALKARYKEAANAYRTHLTSQGWHVGGWFSICEEKCKELYERYQRADLVLREHEKKYHSTLSDARSKVGIFSE